MAAKKTAKKKPGRPPKARGDKPEQFSVRLPPEMKLGLEVYASDNGTSLSYAVESAVAALLSNATLSNGMKVADVLAKVQMEPPGARAISLYGINPRFVNVDERSIIEILFSSVEFRDAVAEPDLKASQRKKMEVIKFSIDHWETIVKEIGGNWWAIKANKESISLRSIVFPTEDEKAAAAKADEDFFEDFLRRTG